MRSSCTWRWPPAAARAARPPIPAPANPTWELYNLDEDPSEKFNLADKRPEIVRELTAMMAAHQKTIEPFENQIPLGRGGGVAPDAGRGAAQ